MSEFDIEKLEKFLQENTIPKVKAHPKTFLGIAKQPHYENVLSNIYAFYFNPNEVHRLKDLFIKSFVELINIKLEKKFHFSDDFSISTEVTTILDKKTQKKGRIDLLFESENDAIIIENKVYHILINNLQNYWDTVKVSNKIGVVLSLTKIPNTGNSNFINITHLEFLNKVMDNAGSYLLKGIDKYIIFLKDLFQNIKNLSNQMEAKDLKFYYDHQEELNNIAKLKFAVRDFLKNEVNLAISLLDKEFDLKIPKGGNEKRLRYYKSINNPDLMFTVVFGGLLDIKKTLWIMVELRGNAIADMKKFKKTRLSKEENDFLNNKFDANSNDWAHFVRKSYLLNENESENLSVIIANKIQKEPFLSILEKVDDFLSEKK